MLELSHKERSICPMGSLEEFQREMDWERGQAQEHCSGECEQGPTVSNLSHGPDAGSNMVVSACKDCAKRLECAIPGMILSPRKS